MGLSLADLSASGAHQRGHFRLSSGLHSGDYLQCALHLARPERAAAAGAELAATIAPLAPELIVAPALGGVIVGHETARALGLCFLFTERHQGRMVLRRGFAVAKGQRVVVVEDVVTTGGSTREVIELLLERGATVAGVASIVNRSGTLNLFAPLPYAALVAVAFPTWPAASCPLCRKDLPIERPGSRLVV